MCDKDKDIGKVMEKVESDPRNLRFPNGIPSRKYFVYTLMTY